MLKPLVEEQAEMRTRWSDPSYRWANDSELRKRYSREFRHDGDQQEVPSSVPSTSSEAKQGA